MTMVFGYVRVSAEDQLVEYNLTTQVDKIETYCKKNEWTLVHIFRDIAVSHDGDPTFIEVDRKGLHSMVAALSEIKIDYIVTYDTSRLWRNDITKVILHKELKKSSVDIRSIEEPAYSVRNTDPNDFLMMELLDQYDRYSFNRKLQKGKRNSIVPRLFGGKSCPMGYKVNHISGNSIVEIDIEKAEIIELIFTKFLEIKSVPKVKDYLDKSGYVTNKGKTFSTTAIKTILKNPFYTGTIIHGFVEHKGLHAPIITHAMFKKVQTLLGDNRKKAPAKTAQQNIKKCKDGFILDQVKILIP